VVVFSRSALDSRQLFDRWERVTARHGLRATWGAWQGGFTTTEGIEAGELAEALASYAGKMFGASDSWGAAEELTMWHYKKSSERYTPLDLLRNLRVGGEGRDFWVLAERFREYAAAYRGKRQLYWSRGLREVLGLVDEASDEDAANADGECDEVLCGIDSKIWPWICGLGLRLELLQAVERFGVGILSEFLEYAHMLRRERLA
jgi:hypothetical protein